MPGMSGVDVFRAMAEPARPDLDRRFVMISGDTLDPDLAAFVSDHAVSVLAKPFDLDMLQRVLDDVVDGAADSAARVGVEALPGLLAEMPGVDQLDEHARRAQVLQAQAVLEDAHDPEAHVEADEVGQLERAHRVVEPDPRPGVDVLGGPDALLVGDASPRPGRA